MNDSGQALMAAPESIMIAMTCLPSELNGKQTDDDSTTNDDDNDDNVNRELIR